jgi:hypothetical protein
MVIIEIMGLTERERERERDSGRGMVLMDALIRVIRIYLKIIVMR